MVEKKTDTYVELIFPKNKEDFVLKNLLILIFALVVLYSIYKNFGHDPIAKPLFFLFLLVVIVTSYKKIYVFLTVDKIVLSRSHLIVSKKGKEKNIPLENIGIKIVHDIKNSKEVSFYDLRNKKIFFYCKENDVDKESLYKFLKKLLLMMDVEINVIEEGTHGEVLPLGKNNNKNLNYLQKKYFFETLDYRWIVYPMVVLIIIVTYHYIKN